MIALIVGTHGMFSKELVKSAEMIFGEQKNIGYVTFVPGEGTENLISKYDEIIKELDCTDGILFMVDLFAGSPFNAASMLAIKNSNMEIVTGVNLPMILEGFSNRVSSTLSELVNIAEKSGKESIRKLIKQASESFEEDDL